MHWMYILLFVLATALTIGLCIYSSRKTVVIEFSYSWAAWVTPILMSFSAFIIAFAAELFGIRALLSKIEVSNIYLLLLQRGLDNGLLIPFICVGLSFLFEKIVEIQNLDYLDYYSDLIAKVCFTIIVIFSCASILLIEMLPIQGYECDKDLQFIINRLLMWTLTVVGTWIGFGFSCGGRIKKENKIRHSIVKPANKKEVIKFWVPIIWPLLLCVGLLVISTFSSQETMRWLTKYGLFFVACFLSTSIVFVLAFKRIVKPNENHSKRDFYRLVKAYKKGKVVKRHYGKNKYYIENGKLFVDKLNIVYPSNDDEKRFAELFDKCEMEIDTNDFDKVLEYLRKRNKDQTDFIDAGYKKCIEDMRNQKLTHI